MTEKNIKILEEINLDSSVIEELIRRVDNVNHGKGVECNRAFYMGFIIGLFDTGIINGISLGSLASEVEEP